MATPARPLPRPPPRSCCSSATARRRPPARSSPAAPPGLHLADTGRAQAEAVAGRASAELKQGRRRVRLAARAHPGDRGADRQGPSASRCRSTEGLLECDFGEWTGAELKDLMQAARVAHGAALPERLPLPRRRESSPRCRPASPAPSTALRAAPPGRHGGVPCPTPTRSRPRSPHALGTHLDLFQRIVISPCSVTADRLQRPAARSCSPSTRPATRCADLRPS